MNYLSYSLWGDLPIYNVGAIRNAELWKEIYPDWQMVVWYDNTVPPDTITKLKELGVLVINMTNSPIYGMFWRFIAVSLENSEYCVFRDCDSRIDKREKSAVDEWIKSGKSLHVMRDHPYHGIPYGNNSLGILGGMWGIKSNSIPLVQMMVDFPKINEQSYGNDQAFLKTVYNILNNDRCTHDEFFEGKPFPIIREKGIFVGGRIDEFNEPVGFDHILV
jgi:hypothetical protein